MHELKEILRKDIVNNQKNQTPWFSGDDIVLFAYIYKIRLEKRTPRQYHIVDEGRQFKQLIIDQIGQTVAIGKQVEESEKEDNELRNNFEKILISASNVIKSIHIFSNIFNIFDKQRNVQLHRALLPLIHINCPEEAKCMKNIRLPDTPAIYQLQFEAFKILQVLKWDWESITQLIKRIGTAGGISEENDQFIIQNINQIQRIRRRSNRNINPYHKYPQIPYKKQTASFDEDIEEEGGIEEIESQLTNGDFYIEYQAQLCKKTIINVRSITHRYNYRESNDQCSESSEEEGDWNYRR
ncbi:MAG: hypothetical protein EZS28_024234 [Streblomastix strix]|uniref:Uncharacterized protein n=1 Tax=Streblomastix strix TaxID=222440 RepID=A0A5J4VCL0_9EUKA|nr:MAG: hypothetical protein EZS28_024234 [Streblomastix strix]